MNIMLTKPISRTFWNKICGADNQWFTENKSLTAKMALMIYRKEGKQEAQAFIYLVRLSEIVRI